MAKRATPLCCWLIVVVAMALCIAAGASARLTCSTNANSALLQDAEEAYGHLRAEGDFNLCQKNCDGDRGCSVLGEHQTAQLKICGVCNICIQRIVIEPLFAAIFSNYHKATDDGKERISGEFAPDPAFELVVEGKGQSVDAGIEKKLSE